MRNDREREKVKRMAIRLWVILLAGVAAAWVVAAIRG